MLGNYLQETTSAYFIFQMHFSWRFKGKPFVDWKPHNMYFCKQWRPRWNAQFAL